MTYTDYRNIHRYIHNNLCWLEGEDQLVGLFNYFHIHIICMCHINWQKEIVFILYHIIIYFVLLFTKISHQYN